MFPYLVIDLNQLRSEETIAHTVSRCRNEGLQLLVSDGAGFELSKSTEVLDTWRRSIEFISPHTDVIVVPSKMTDMMREETRSERPIGSLADNVATEAFRSILAEYANGDESLLRGLVDGPIKEKMPASLDAWSDFKAQHDQIIQLRDFFKKELSEQEVKRMRRSPDSAFATWLSSADGLRFVSQGITRRGVNEVSALWLASAPSVTGSYLSSMAALALYWLAFGGLEAAKPEKAANDIHDIEYAVLGSLSVDLLSADKRLQKIHEAVKSAQVSRHRWLKDRLRAS